MIYRLHHSYYDNEPVLAHELEKAEKPISAKPQSLMSRRGIIETVLRVRRPRLSWNMAGQNGLTRWAESVGSSPDIVGSYAIVLITYLATFGRDC
ncbi:hypothetical protein J2P12_08395 [Candidatus Bathyarchaeota archaeon]|nr:hypothetical protein [Candidatus Bathyarchaeota archaeon]